MGVVALVELRVDGHAVEHHLSVTQPAVMELLLVRSFVTMVESSILTAAIARAGLR